MTNENSLINNENGKNLPLPPMPKNLWDKYTERLEVYNAQKEEIQEFIKENLKDGIDYGKNYKGAEKSTLLKSGAEKIAGLIESRIKIYPDFDSWNMMGKKPGVCYVGYLIDQELLYLIVRYLLKVGMQFEQQVIKLFAWGEGRGAYELDEKTYSDGKYLKGSVNRAIKIAEKRCKVDVIIGTLGLEFGQDEEYGKDGQLKNDPKLKKSGKMINLSKENPQNKALFQNIMTIVNLKEGKIMIFSQKEITEYIKKASSIVKNLDALRDLNNSLRDIAMERVAEIKKKEIIHEN